MTGGGVPIPCRTRADRGRYGAGRALVTGDVRPVKGGMIPAVAAMPDMPELVNFQLRSLKK